MQLLGFSLSGPAGRAFAVPLRGWILAAVAFSCTAVLSQETAPATNTVPTTPRPTFKLVPLDVLTNVPLPEVSSVSGWTQPITQAPSSVTVVTEDEIKRYGYRTLADILRSVRDLHVTYDRAYSFLGVRGFNPADFNSRILLLVNGHRVNQNLSDAAALGTDFILDVDLIRQVEIVRGPGSVLYGNNAFFGVINVVTREGTDLPGVGFEASGSYGAFDTWTGRVTYGKSIPDGPQFLISGSIYDSTGDDALYFKEFNTPDNNVNNGLFLDGDADRAYRAFGSISNWNFTLESGYAWREKHNPTAQHYTTFNDNHHQLTDARWYADLRFERELAENLDLLARAYYDQYQFDGQFPFPQSSTDATQPGLDRDERLGQWYGFEAHLTRRFFEHHTVAAGAEFRHDFNQERTYTQLEPIPYTYVHSTDDRMSYSAFVNGEFALFPHRFTNMLTLNAGVRYDGYDKFDDAVNPRVALIYHPWTNSTFKAIYGTAFRTPNFFELFDPSNQDISPERIATYEAVCEQNIGANFRASVVGFYNRIDDVIAFDFRENASRYRNFDGAETLGFSVEFDAFGTRDWLRGARGRIAYTYQDTEDLETGARPVDSPRHLVKFNLSVPFWEERLIASTDVQYTSQRASARPGPGGVLVAGEDAEGFVLVNFNLLARKLVKGLELSAGVYNLFDEHYADPATLIHRQELIPQDGRTFRVKATYRF